VKSSLDFSAINDLEYCTGGRPTFEQIKTTYRNLKKLLRKNPFELDRHIKFLNFIDWVTSNGDCDLYSAPEPPPEMCPCVECVEQLKKLHALHVTKAQQRIAQRSGNKPEKHDEGYIYLLKSGEYYKIGKTKYLDKRVTQLGVALPDPCVLIYAFKAKSRSRSEEDLHRRFNAARRNGEWFTLTPEQVEEIKSIRSEV